MVASQTAVPNAPPHSRVSKDQNPRQARRPAPHTQNQIIPTSLRQPLACILVMCAPRSAFSKTVSAWSSLWCAVAITPLPPPPASAILSDRISLASARLHRLALSCMPAPGPPMPPSSTPVGEKKNNKHAARRENSGDNQHVGASAIHGVMERNERTQARPKHTEVGVGDIL